MWFKTILVATLCCYCEGIAGPFYAVKAWNVPKEFNFPNCYQLTMVPVEIEKLHSKCTCQDNADWDLDVFAFSPKEQPSLNRTLVANVVRDLEKVRAALKSNCKCDIFTDEATVPVLQPFSINKEQDFFVQYILDNSSQMLGQFDSQDIPIMAFLFCDHIPTAEELESATSAITLNEGKLICDLVK